MFVQSKNTFDDKTVTFLDDFTRSQLEKYPRHAAHRVEPRRDRQRPHRRARRAARHADRRRGAGRVRRRAPRTSSSRPSRPARSTSSSAPARAASTRAPRSCARSATPCTRRRASAPRRRVSRSSASACSTTSKANRALLTYLAILFVFLFLSVRLRSIVRALLSLVPVLIAVGAASLFAWILQPQAQPDDRGRRAARRRGVHRVHVADPPALRRRTAARLHAARGNRRHRVAHRSRVHRVGADRDRRASP